MSAPIRVALAIAEPALAERLASLLADIPDFAIVADPDEADAVLVSPDPPHRDDAPPLTAREQEVLALMAEGASNRTIAEALGISLHTAKFHVGQVIDKLDATGRTDAVAQAARIGVIRL